MNNRRIVGWIYIFRLSHDKFKIGVSSNTYVRQLYLEKGIGESIDLKLRMYVLFPYFFEKIMHFIFSFLNFKLDCNKCSGYTEWFRDFLGIVRIIAELTLLLIAIIQLSAIGFVIIMASKYF